MMSIYSTTSTVSIVNTTDSLKGLISTLIQRTASYLNVRILIRMDMPPTWVFRICWGSSKSKGLVICQGDIRISTEHCKLKRFIKWYSMTVYYVSSLNDLSANANIRSHDYFREHCQNTLQTKAYTGGFQQENNVSIS